MNDPVIVLGAAQYDGRLSKTLRARLEQALIIYAHNPQLTFFTLGANMPGDRFTEAGVARDFLIANGVPASQVIAVEEGYDTASSLAAVLQVSTRQKSPPTESPTTDSPTTDSSTTESPTTDSPLIKATVITDSIHIPRTWLIARGLGIKAQMVAAQSSPTAFPKACWWRSLAHEVGGIIYLGARRFLPENSARAVRRGLYKVEGILRPTWRARHQHLRAKR